MSDDEETLTAYHEAGHAVIGYALGGSIERIQLGGEAEGSLPNQFGDCLIRWSPIEQLHTDCNWRLQRELMTILAGPVAEMIYRGESLHPATYPPWQSDWLQAMEVCKKSIGETVLRGKFLEEVVLYLHRHLSSDNCWAAIAAVADELLAHDYLEQEQLTDALDFWLNRN